MGDPGRSSMESPRRLNRPIVLVAGAVVVAVVAAVVAAVVVIRDDPPPDGRFAAEPDACHTILESGADAALPEWNDLRRHPGRDTEGGDRSACYVIAGQDRVYATVQYFVHKWKTQDETRIAEKTVAEMARGFRPVSGIGDQAYVKDGVVWLRVSNLTINIRDAPADAETATLQFARILGWYLKAQ